LKKYETSVNDIGNYLGLNGEVADTESQIVLNLIRRMSIVERELLLLQYNIFKK
jgi:hypothetical protein